MLHCHIFIKRRDENFKRKKKKNRQKPNWSKFYVRAGPGSIDVTSCWCCHSLWSDGGYLPSSQASPQAHRRTSTPVFFPLQPTAPLAESRAMMPLCGEPSSRLWTELGPADGEGVASGRWLSHGLRLSHCQQCTCPGKGGLLCCERGYPGF